MIWRLLRDELARGSMLNLGFILSNLLAQFGAGLLLATYLGPDGVGAFAIGMLVLETTMIFVHLPGVAFVREFAALEREDALATVAAVKLILCVPATAFILLVAGPLGALFQVPPTMIALLALYPLFSAVASIGVMVFESRRDMVRRNLPFLTENLARLLLVAGLVFGLPLFPARTESAALAWVFGVLPAAAVSFALAGFPDARRMRPRKAREYISFGWRTTVAQLLQKQLLWVGTAAVYLAYLGSSLSSAQANAGLFKTAYAAMFYIVLFGAAVTTMLYPMFARAFAQADEAPRKAEVHRLLSLAFYYEAALALPLAAALLAAAPWAFAFFLPGFTASAPLAQLLTVSGVLFCLTLPAIVLLPAANRPDLVLRLLVVMAAVAVALNVLLVPQTGAPWGGAVGAVIADWATAAVGFAYGYRLVRKLGVPFPSFALFRASLSKAPSSADRAP